MHEAEANIISVGLGRISPTNKQRTNEGKLGHVYVK